MLFNHSQVSVSNNLLLELEAKKKEGAFDRVVIKGGALIVVVVVGWGKWW